MGGNPRHATWSARQWANVAYTVAEIRDRRWTVQAQCRTCEDRFRVRLDVVIQMRGPDSTLWGKHAPCPRVRCQGRVVFYVRPRGGDREFLMMNYGPPQRADREAARMLEG